ncbi:acetolactate decarboxylase [Microbacterium caowuchunii]|uniref:Alpha-acetolactate decarboxylase n=1 Tax=Microbacterium caowuchunii TaxID=2614638 RepID=A0A5N0TNA7_9MICO|nr:acetolactate decarboxylase [Microbacterium caowuchunii]KAA9135784.1 acetolactate decarboxylase [Microbacterium caowuchunii]
MTDGQLIAETAVTQFAVLDALLAGAYESGIPVADVRSLGDFGIGCCESLGGEVIVLDGEVFECTVGERPDRMKDSQILPFVDVCRFPATPGRSIERTDLPAFTSRVEGSLVSRNLFHAVRVDGVFTALRVRVTQRQEHPFRPLPEVTNEQIETVLADVPGTLVGFWAPAIYQGITVAGLHLHFIAEDRSIGGHVLDVIIGSGELRLAAYSRFDLRLPMDEHFLRTELTHSEDHRIVAAEGGAVAPAR